MFAERPGRPYVGCLTFGGRVTTLIILAMVFVFVALRLWSVLGRRTGHEQPIAKPDAVLTPRSTSVTVPQTDAQTLIAQESTMATTAVNGLRAIASAEPQFDAARFLDGAKQAYGMILEAFWRGDKETLRSLVDPEVAGAFEQAIADREEAGEVDADEACDLARPCAPFGLSGHGKRGAVDPSGGCGSGNGHGSPGAQRARRMRRSPILAAEALRALSDPAIPSTRGASRRRAPGTCRSLRPSAAPR